MPCPRSFSLSWASEHTHDVSSYIQRNMITCGRQEWGSKRNLKAAGVQKEE